ncbi:kinase-like domain-containing protein [Rhizophagus irregularis DAOM 181602=DAOM 197198]|nr:kinase-like domain-containing protein [Rhizophagus irregularis DAOM 181602=DAOM 197198]
MFYTVKLRSTGKIKSDTFVILISSNQTLNQSRGSDALHLEILPVSNSSSSTNLSLNEKRSHFRQVFNSNKGGRDSLDYVFETVRREICQLTGKKLEKKLIIEKPDDSLYPFRKPKHDNCDDGDLNSSHNPSKKRNNHSSNNHSNLSNDFKYNRLLSAGENNKKVLECEFCGKTIALKSIDLTKKSKCLDEFLNEVKIYKVLAKLQGIYIPKLLFYSDLANGMSFVMGMTIVGTLLNHHRIDKWLKNKVIMTLKKVHEYNILHNDIHKENILIDEKGYVYLLD